MTLMMKRRAFLVAGPLWLLTASGGSLALLRYHGRPGPDRRAPDRWPVSSRLQRDPTLPTLLLFAHPRCACTQASLAELERLMALCHGLVAARVLFFLPDGATDSFVRTAQWRRAAEIPGVTVEVDRGGEESKRFHAATSGHVALYDAAGRLLFDGGITGARAHEGDNPGRSAIVALLHRGRAAAATSVFGCAIHELQK